MRHNQYDELLKKLSEEHSCFVLLTCDKAAESGSMNVNMSWEGDAVLASFLLKGAQSQIDEDIDREVSQSEAYLRVVK